jgi:hypothetical protein
MTEDMNTARHRWDDLSVAAVVHAANTAVQEHLGDDSPSEYRLWNEPEDIRDSAVAGVVKARSGATPEQMWESWAEFKRAQGWKWGPEKDREKMTHPCLVDEYEMLPQGQRDKDVVFLAIVRALTVGA